MVVTIKLAVYLDDRYLSSSDINFVEVIQNQIDKFIQRKSKTASYVRVLLFPPVNSYQRLLIHRTAQQYTDLHSFSVGEGEGRRTVICHIKDFKSDPESAELMSSGRPSSSRGRGRGKFKDYSPTPTHQPSSHQDCNYEAKKHELHDVKSHEKEKIAAGTNKQSRGRYKRPEIQVYVPRGRRLLQEQQSQHHDCDDESWDVDDQRTGSDKPVYENSHSDLSKSHEFRLNASTEHDESHTDHESSSGGVSVINDDVSATRSKSESEESKFQRKPRAKNQVYVPPYRRHLEEKEAVFSESKSECFDSQKREPDFVSNDIVESQTSKRMFKSNRSPDDKSSVKKSKKKLLDDSSHNLEKENNTLFSKNSDNANERTLNFEDVCDTNITSNKDQGMWINTDQLKYTPINNTNASSLLEPEIDDGTAEYLRNEYLQALGEEYFVKTNKKYQQFSDFSKNVDSTNAREEDIDDEMVQEFDLDDIEIHSQEDVSVIKQRSDHSVAVDQTSKNEIIPDSLSVESSDDESFALCPEQPTNESCDNLESAPDKRDRENKIIDMKDDRHETLEKSGNTSEKSKSKSAKVKVVNSHLINNYKLKNETTEKCTGKNKSKITKEVRNRNESNTMSQRTNCESKNSHSLQVEVTKMDSNNCDTKDIKNKVYTGKVTSLKNKNDTAHINAKEKSKNYESERRKNSKTKDHKTEDIVPIHESAVSEVKGYEKESNSSLTIQTTAEYIQSDKLTASKETQALNKNHNSSSSAESSDGEEDEDSWDKMFDEDGECLDPKALDELTSKVGKVKIKRATIDYYNYQPKDPQLDYEELGHIIEIYDFPAEFTTRELLTAFQGYSTKGFDIKWVDDTHALGVFASSIAAQSALNMTHPLLKVRSLSESSRQCKVKARKCTEFLQPYKPRPETSAVTARRLVTGALGLAPKLSKEQRDQERKMLKQAREKKKQDRKQREDMWEGTIKGDTEMQT